MNELAQTIITICAVIAAIAGVVTISIKIWCYLTRAIKFMMKMLMTMLDIMDGQEINGQVKELRTRAEEFNIDN